VLFGRTPEQVSRFGDRNPFQSRKNWTTRMRLLCFISRCARISLTCLIPWNGNTKSIKNTHMHLKHHDSSASIIPALKYSQYMRYNQYTGSVSHLSPIWRHHGNARSWETCFWAEYLTVLLPLLQLVWAIITNATSRLTRLVVTEWLENLILSYRSVVTERCLEVELSV